MDCGLPFYIHHATYPTCRVMPEYVLGIGETRCALASMHYLIQGLRFHLHTTTYANTVNRYIIQ